MRSFFALVLVVTACGGTEYAPNMPAQDASNIVERVIPQVIDAGIDAGQVADSGVLEIADAATTVDAGESDAGSIQDAGNTAVDAGGSTDAGYTVGVDCHSSADCFNGDACNPNDNKCFPLGQYFCQACSTDNDCGGETCFTHHLGGGRVQLFCTVACTWDTDCANIPNSHCASFPDTTNGMNFFNVCAPNTDNVCE